MASEQEVPAKKEDVKFCVVCGAGSHREDWQKKTDFVACDGHPKDEVDAAVKSAQGTVGTAPAVTKPALASTPAPKV